MKNSFLLQFLSFVLISAQMMSPASAYVFHQDPKTWGDADVEAFLFLSQVQKKTALNKQSNLCIEVSEPVAGGKQQMRIISKVGDNKEGGLFQTGKSEIAKGGTAEADVEKIKKIVEMSTGYQQAIMDQDESAGAPKVRDRSELKQYMTAEVIGYTDGQPIKGTVYGGLDNKSNSYTTNKQLGKQRASYLSSQLGLSDSFAKIKASSVESESALKSKEFESIRDCATWRTAEVRMSFQTGSKATDDAIWSMTTKMAPPKQRLMMQYEASKQVQEALAKNNKAIMYTESPDPADPKKTIKTPTAELKNFCESAAYAIKSKITAYQNCKKINNNSCNYDCGSAGKISIHAGSASSGGPFTLGIHAMKAGETSWSSFQYEKDLQKDETLKAAIKTITDKSKARLDQQLTESFPDCAKDASQFKDLKQMVKQVEGVSSTCVANRSPFYNISEGDPCASAAIKEVSGGLSGRLMRCVNMKRVMNFMYSQGECRPGAEFSKVTFPHMNAHLGCKYCGSGWNTKKGAASFIHRDDMDHPDHFTDKNTTSANPTYQSLQSPGIHEIGDCADCKCTGKNEKLKKVFLVEEAHEDKSVIDTINKGSCYCTPPVAPSCGVGPQGSTADATYTKLGQKYFYDACTGKFVEAADNKGLKDQKAEQILSLMNQVNKGCSSDPAKCPAANMSEEISKVNAMMCETQKYKLPTDDPAVDCAKEAAMSAQ